MSPTTKDYGSFSSKNHIDSLRQWQQCYHSDSSCPICLQTATFPVETNCGHLFCGSCLIAYWKHGSWLDAISCPLCRQKVILLYNLSCESLPDKPSKGVVYDIRNYNKRFSGQPRPFTDYLYDMPLLLHLAVRGIFTLGGLVWIFFLRVLVCSFGTLMSITSPFDGMPEPLCGILAAVDDLVVIYFAGSPSHLEQILKRGGGWEDTSNPVASLDVNSTIRYHRYQIKTVVHKDNLTNGITLIG